MCHISNCVMSIFDIHQMNDNKYLTCFKPISSQGYHECIAHM